MKYSIDIVPQPTRSPFHSRRLILSAVLMAALAIPAPAETERRFSLEITAGAGRHALGDVNAYLADFPAQLAAQVRPEELIAGSEPRSLHAGAGFDAALRLSLSPRFTIAFRTGYRSAASGLEDYEIVATHYVFRCRENLSIRAVPLLLEARLEAPIIPKLSLEAFAAAGAAFTFFRGVTEILPDAGSISHAWSARAAAAASPALLAGAGCVYEVAPRFAILLEARALRLRAAGFSGTMDYGYNDGFPRAEDFELLYYEFSTAEPPRTVRSLSLPLAQHGRRYDVVRPGVVDLSGWDLRIGIRVGASSGKRRG